MAEEINPELCCSERLLRLRCNPAAIEAVLVYALVHKGKVSMRTGFTSVELVAMLLLLAIGRYDDEIELLCCVALRRFLSRILFADLPQEWTLDGWTHFAPRRQQWPEQGSESGNQSAAE